MKRREIGMTLAIFDIETTDVIMTRMIRSGLSVKLRNWRVEFKNEDLSRFGFGTLNADFILETTMN